MTASAWLSLGSNLEPEQHLAEALGQLRQRFGSLRISPVYRCAAVGFDGPAFLNLAVGLDSDLEAIELDAWLHALENRLGRRRDVPRYSSRTIDIDLLLFDDQVLRGPGHLRLPRADLVEQAFVLKPMADLAPELIHPVLKRSLAELWRSFTGERALEAVDSPFLADYRPRGGDRPEQHS